MKSKAFPLSLFSFIDLNKKIWQWTILLFLAMTWGSSFILMKKGLEGFSYYQVAAIRIFSSFVFFLPLSFKYFKYLKKEHIFPILVVSIFGNGIPAVLFTKAQTEVSSSLAGMLNSLTPFFVMIVGLLVYKAKSGWWNKLGIFIGLLGAIGLILSGSGFSINHGNNWYGLLIVLATIMYGISTNVNKYQLNSLDGLTISATQFLFIGPIAGIYLLFADFSSGPATNIQMQSLVYVLMLAFFSSVLATVAFNYMIKYTSALFAASVTYVAPVFALMWGILDGEHIAFFQIISISIIFIGVYLVNKK